MSLQDFRHRVRDRFEALTPRDRRAIVLGLVVLAPALYVLSQEAAEEENDHIAWTADRIHELGGHTSYLNPLWYAGSFSLGALAGLVGDRWSLGFVAETEKQVVRHLEGHLEQLSPEDKKSRAILEQMKTDEGKHATTAISAGAASFPKPIQKTMEFMSKVFTNTAYWI